MVEHLFKALFLALVITSSVYAGEKVTIDSNELLKQPLVERYVLDELKELRNEQLILRKDLIKEVTRAELSTSDRAVMYATDTVNNIFYIIATVSSLLLVIGFKSLKDLKKDTKRAVEKMVIELSQDFEDRLLDIEQKAKQRYKIITQTQEKPDQSQKINALWKRAEIEENLQEKLNLYDEILTISANDLETLVYKADTLLDLGETRWALSLCDQVIALDDNYALSYWQRACAHAKLNSVELARKVIKKDV